MPRSRCRRRGATLDGSHRCTHSVVGTGVSTRRANRTRELTWYSTGELQQMLAYLDVLAAERTALVAVTHPDGKVSLIKGLGDPQAARIWLLQALTGRRASEILMLDHQPCKQSRVPNALPTATTPMPSWRNCAISRPRSTGCTHDPGRAGGGQCDHRTATLARRDLPELVTEVLVHRHQTEPGRAAPRPYATYNAALGKLDKLHGLTDAAGNALRFTQTHRLRHTRATELLNDGVPIHVVQRYLGHKSPEMTLRYAATLAATAEAEFLKHKKIGAHGVEIAISPSDILDMTQLSQRTDRVLPNGYVYYRR